MIIEIRVPEAGESITQVELAKWLVEDGAYIDKDQEIAEIDSDKATLTINADDSGVLKIIIEEGSTIEPGKIIGQIDTSAEKPSKPDTPEKQQVEKESKEDTKGTGKEPVKDKPSDDEPDNKQDKKEDISSGQDFTLSPQAKKVLEEHDISIDDILKNPDNKRITKKDVLIALSSKSGKGIAQTGDSPEGIESESWGGTRNVQTIKMTTLRKKIAERLVAVKNQTAMLTTFNEVDMSSILALREKYKEKFQEKYGIKPGLMSFFAKAVTLSIPFFPQVNGQIDDGNIILPDYTDLGIAVSTPKGLMVPNIRNAESKSLLELEQEILQLAKKARDNKITIEELTGGTFSITNGGVFGSMLSTPIINPPQSAILGMHNIVERPVAINGKVEIRPVMYVALSYDHRIVDGRESVGFLVKVKEFLEDPAKMLFDGKDPGAILLGL
jgi:2-oxoglutarate dehydrogenase E2 component (dihydrolipoamide succinyltransferase)